jgi:ankyrin repeat protein
MTIKDLNKELAQEVSREDADIEKITKLLEEGARANTYTNGQPLLHAACKAGNPQVVSLLLEKGASPNARGFQGTTPLYIASQNGHAEVVKELLKRDADMKYAKQTGATAKWVAKKEGHKDVLEILEEEEKKRLEEDEKRKITS